MLRNSIRVSMNEEELGNKEEPGDVGELDRIAETFTKVKEFLETIIRA